MPAGAWLGSSPSTPRRQRPWQLGQIPVGRPAPSWATLNGTGSPPVPGQLPSGTPILRGYSLTTTIRPACSARPTGRANGKDDRDLEEEGGSARKSEDGEIFSVHRRSIGSPAFGRTRSLGSSGH